MELQKLKVQLQVEKNKCFYLEDKVKELQGDKAFLQSQLQERHQPSNSALSSIDISSVSESVGPFVSHSFGDEGPSAGKSRVKREKNSPHHSNPRMRMKTVASVINRYKKALMYYNKLGSMKRAFEHLGLDRNTISHTAPIAELSMVSLQVFSSYSPWDEKREKLAEYADRCHTAQTAEIRTEIAGGKSKGELLPIVYGK